MDAVCGFLTWCCMMVFVVQLFIIMFRLCYQPALASQVWNAFLELEDDLDEDEEYMFFHMR